MAGPTISTALGRATYTCIEWAATNTKRERLPQRVQRGSCVGHEPCWSSLKMGRGGRENIKNETTHRDETSDCPVDAIHLKGANLECSAKCRCVVYKQQRPTRIITHHF